MFTSRLDVYISRYGDFFAHNDNDTTDYFTPCACVRGKYVDARIQRLEVMQNVSVAFIFHNLSRELYCAYAYSDGVSHIESACG